MNSTLQLPTGTWTLDPGATTVTVSVTWMLVLNVSATLRIESGAIELVDGTVTRVEIVADAASYTSKNAKRNEHVRDSDFLDAEQHPSIRFEAITVQPTSAGYIAAGSVTVKGRTAPAEVTISNVVIDGDTATFAASAAIDRNDVGVDKMPSLVIGARLQLDVAATASRAT